MTEAVRLTQDELREMLVERFGEDPMAWAFRCPHCGDVATGQDFRDALAAHPRANRDGSATTASDIIGQECIGRTLGALVKPTATHDRGCDWCAYGLFRGPWLVDLGEGKTMGCFPVADAPAPPDACSREGCGRPQAEHEMGGVFCP